jgi:hypothetical protein
MYHLNDPRLPQINHGFRSGLSGLALLSRLPLLPLWSWRLLCAIWPWLARLFICGGFVVLIRAYGTPMLNPLFLNVG